MLFNYPIAYSITTLLLDFFRLIRLPNLLIVALTQWLIYGRFILPSLEATSIVGKLSDFPFYLLCGATVLVTAGGYIVNDLLDVESDAINRPGKNKVHALGVALCLWWYLISVLLGFAFSLLLAFQLKELLLLGLYPLAVGVLALYTRYIKPTPLAGNALVAIYCAGVPFLLIVAERRALLQLWEEAPQSGIYLVGIVFVYALFAALATVLRELVKDMQDVVGDRHIGRRTLPVWLGMERSRGLALFLVFLCLTALILPIWWDWPAFQTLRVLFFIAGLGLALVYIAWGIVRARQQHDYGRLSSQLKLFLLAGLGLLMLL